MNAASLGIEINNMCDILCKYFNRKCIDCHANIDVGLCVRQVVNDCMEFIDRNGLR